VRWERTPGVRLAYYLACLGRWIRAGTEDNAVARALAAEAPEWRNEMAARSLFSLIGYRPGKLAGRLVMPLLIFVADDDTAARCHWLSRAAEQASRGELRRYRGGHFAAYLGEVFEQMVSDQVKFLRRHLASTPAATAGAG
jgi:hypothetical protein